MDGKTTIKYLQTFIRQKDYHPELLKDYFLKLTEEVGELSRAMRLEQVIKVKSRMNESRYPSPVVFEENR